MSALLVMLALLSPTLGVTLVQEVFLGDTVQLRCPSNDDNHRFQFWRLQRENIVIGPTNKYNRDKFRYTVIDGTLTIRGVSSNEHGLYTCICKHLTDESFNSDDVELIVRRAWAEEETEENSPSHVTMSKDHLTEQDIAAELTIFHDIPSDNESVDGLEDDSPEELFTSGYNLSDDLVDDLPSPNSFMMNDI